MGETPEQNMDPSQPQDGSGAPVDSGGLARRAVTWLAMGGLGFLMLEYFGLEGLTSIAFVAVGLGLVIFIHELGHFVVAKLCDIHVETFSIGFGPPIPGCSFQRGETFYKIAWFPLGGYVKMVGEGNESEEDENDPRSFKNKSVSQRMAVISAGVIMNMIFGFICFIFVFRTHGVDLAPAIVGAVDTNGPAWQEGLRSGAVIREIGGIKNPMFEDLQFSVVFSKAGEKIKLVYEVPGQTSGPQTMFLEPRREGDSIFPVIGVSQSSSMRLAFFPQLKAHPPYLFGSAAAAATPSFKKHDLIKGMTDPDQDGKVTPLPPDPRITTESTPDYFTYWARSQRLKGKPVVFRVERREGEKDPEQLDIKVGPAYHYDIGARMQMGQVIQVRIDSPAARAKAPAGEPGVREGDIIEEVEASAGNGKKVRWVTTRPIKEKVPADVEIRDLDPMRLPDELSKWASQTQGERKIALTVLRKVVHKEKQRVVLNLDWDNSWQDDAEMPLTLRSPLAIPGLGLAYRVEGVVEDVAPDSPAAKVLKRGDLVKAVQFRETTKDPGVFQPGPWKNLERDMWVRVFSRLQQEESKQIGLRIERGGQTMDVEVTAEADPTWPSAELGMILEAEKCPQKAATLLGAVQLGMHKTYRDVVMIYKNLRAIFSNRVSVDSIGGPIQISRLAYYSASESIYRFILFLGTISINLAVINFLPIPILDGGHMVFLIYEKLRGAPASETIRAAATYAGLLLILTLMLFVTWIDIARLFH